MLKTPQTVQDVRVAYVYIENGKSSAVEFKNVFCMNGH